MRYYPIFVDLTEKDCLVVGAGQVGRRKIASLVEAGARSVLVVDTREPDEDFRELLEHDNLKYEVRTFEESDLYGKSLVIASTSDEDLNWHISNLCKQRNIFCNIVDQPEKCSFIVPAMFRQGDLTMAVSTGGTSPALAKKIRRDLDEYFGSEYGQFLLFMSALRPLVLDLGLGTDYNTGLFRRLVNSELMDSIKARDFEKARTILEMHLPEELHPNIKDLMNELL